MMIAVWYSAHGVPRWGQFSNNARRMLSIVTRRPSLSYCRHPPQAAVAIHVPTTPAHAMAYSNTRHVQDNAENEEEEDSVVVYESPFAGMVNRLRAITLLTAATGSVGLPALVAFKGTVPTAGFVALCLSFGTGSLAGDTLRIFSLCLFH